MNEEGGSKRHEQSFADVLNRLGGPRWSGPAYDHNERSAAPPAEQPEISWLASSRPATGSGPPDQWPAESEDWGEPQNFASAVRPYTWTRGRTKPVYDLAIEALVSTRVHGLALAGLTSVEHRSVAELCHVPRSVAEVAALLGLPLGVARVLLGDMADLGLVVVHRTAANSGDVPGVSFLERVLSGLRRL